MALADERIRGPGARSPSCYRPLRRSQTIWRALEAVPRLCRPLMTTKPTTRPVSEGFSGLREF
jgi:hypothetical protein